MTNQVYTVGVHEAKTQLSELLRRVEAGEEIVIQRSNVPVARLVGLRTDHVRAFGFDAGAFSVPDDFDAPLPGEIGALFE